MHLTAQGQKPRGFVERLAHPDDPAAPASELKPASLSQPSQDQWVQAGARKGRHPCTDRSRAHPTPGATPESSPQGRAAGEAAARAPSSCLTGIGPKSNESVLTGDRRGQTQTEKKLREDGDGSPQKLEEAGRILPWSLCLGLTSGLQTVRG